MRTGLFGKLPAKRDFVALGAPREFLGVWETWLQGSISASRQRLGEAWQAAFLRAPIWRFWLGADLCGGAPVLGAFMSSVDGVGRYFPLTVFTRPEGDEQLPPPEIDAHDAWLAQAENILLSALADGGTYEQLTEAVGRLPGPQPASAAAPDLARWQDGSLVSRGPPAGEALAAMRVLDQARVYAGMSYWWTLGGEGFEPRLIAQRRLPDPYLFTAMLTGGFDDHAG